MSNKKIRVVIVGGGTAGWSTAAALSNVFRREHVPIHLIESDEIGTVGVGEATIPGIASFNKALGIDENEFLKFTKGTFKLGIEFVNWGKKGDSYIHPFGGYGTKLDNLQFYHHWQKHFVAGGKTDIYDYSICVQAAKLNRFSRPSENPKSPLYQINYAYHFDASLYAKLLSTYARRRGVIRTEGLVESVNLNSSDGYIQSIQLKSGQVIEADLFIDCTGFHGLMIEGALKTGYQDWSHLLPCDRAVVAPTISIEEPIPYTRATAQSAGWQWRIPLQHRVGNGHVYSSQYMSDDEAKNILLRNLQGDLLSEPRLIKFKTGMRKKFWNKNCVAIGLSSGFMEPLESTSIHLIQSSISQLIALFPAQGINQVEVDKYNQILTDEFVLIRDFLVLHYHATARDDSPFWNYVRQMKVSERLNQKLDLYRSCGRIYRDNSELFDEINWLAVLHGQGIRAESSHPAADVRPTEVVDRQLYAIKDLLGKAVNSMPTHQQYISKHCSASKK